jgi:threonine dehydrogenase-like Zn-dependent dehydrogenase
MKALVLSSYRPLEFVEAAKPEPCDDELLIRVIACGICGSDVYGYDGSTGRRIPQIIMGHEAAGVVEAVGIAVSGFRPGDRVTFDSTVFCGKCFFCLRGQVNLCDERRVIGVSTPNFRRMGAFAEYITVPARICYHLPDDLRFSHAALIEAVSVAVHAVSLSPITLDDTVVIVGAGMIGFLALQAARLAGAGAIIVGVGPSAQGEFHPEAVRQMKGAGVWLQVNGEAIYATRPREDDRWGRRRHRSVHTVEGSPLCLCHPDEMARSTGDAELGAAEVRLQGHSSGF